MLKKKLFFNSVLQTFLVLAPPLPRWVKIIIYHVVNLYLLLLSELTLSMWPGGRGPGVGEEKEGNREFPGNQRVSSAARERSKCKQRRGKGESYVTPGPAVHRCGPSIAASHPSHL